MKGESLSLFVSYLVSQRSYSLIAELVSELRTDFTVSPKRDSSFYPKITLYVAKDVLTSHLPQVRQVDQSIPEHTVISLQVSALKKTESGLLLLTFQESPELRTLQDNIARHVQPYRATPEFPPTYGYKYFAEPLHITVGMNAENFDEGKLQEQSGTVSELHIEFDSYGLFTKNTSWETEGKLQRIRDITL